MKNRYTLWNKPSSEWSPLKAGAKLNKKELKILKKEIDEEMERERARGIGKEIVPSPLSWIRVYN